MTTSTEDPQARFEMAWTDLDQRLIKGAQNLREQAEKVREQAEKDRLIDKAAGVEYGIDIWEELTLSSDATKGDFAAVWRTFTDEMTARLGRDGFQPGYYQGIYLALDYQRGYGPDVDAPRPLPRTV